MNDIEIIPTNTCPPDVAELARRSKSLSAFSKWVQLDVSDGAFTPVRSWPYNDAQWSELESMAAGALPYAGILNYETHLMVEDPARVGELLARAGCSRVIAHIEVFANPDAALAAFAQWKAAGAREVGLALLIDTPLSALEGSIAECDVVQVMSIAKLGSQGAAYDPRAITRIAELHTKYPRLTIAVDGGIGESNIADLARAGARRFGVGSAISKSPDPAAAYRRLQELAEGAL